jgi:hypothetical protein
LLIGSVEESNCLHVWQMAKSIYYDEEWLFLVIVLSIRFDKLINHFHVRIVYSFMEFKCFSNIINYQKNHF